MSGIVSPSALAVLRLITISNVVRLDDGQIRRFRPLEYAAGVEPELAIRGSDARPIAHETARIDELAKSIDRRQSVPGREGGNARALVGEEGSDLDEQRAGTLLSEGFERRFEVPADPSLDED